MFNQELIDVGKLIFVKKKILYHLQLLKSRKRNLKEINKIDKINQRVQQLKIAKDKINENISKFFK